MRLFHLFVYLACLHVCLLLHSHHSPPCFVCKVRELTWIKWKDSCKTHVTSSIGTLLVMVGLVVSNKNCGVICLGWRKGIGLCYLIGLLWLRVLLKGLCCPCWCLLCLFCTFLFLLQYITVGASPTVFPKNTHVTNSAMQGGATPRRTPRYLSFILNLANIWLVTLFLWQLLTKDTFGRH